MCVCVCVTMSVKHLVCGCCVRHCYWIGDSTQSFLCRQNSAPRLSETADRQWVCSVQVHRAVRCVAFCIFATGWCLWIMVVWSMLPVLHWGVVSSAVVLRWRRCYLRIHYTCDCSTFNCHLFRLLFNWLELLQVWTTRTFELLQVWTMRTFVLLR